MPLLYDIQEAVVQEGADLGSILLKLRFLAARLGSGVLEEWVKHESAGYPEGVEVPDYRIAPVSFTGTFSGPFGSSIRNAPIPTHAIKQIAGEHWVTHQIRESISGVDELVRGSAKSGSLGIDASNLILLLQGKIYEDYACNSVSGKIARTSLTEIQQAVRGKILELTLELEKSIPAAAEVSFGASHAKEADPEKIQQITQQIIYGSVGTAVAGSHNANVSVKVNERDESSFVRFLVESGIPEQDASELVEILASEYPESAEKPFGKKAKKWITSNLKKAVDGGWKASLSVATSVLTEAAKKYYGL